MQKIGCRLTVFFEDPYWVAVYDRIAGRNLQVCKITFGTEPKDNEIYNYFLYSWQDLKFSPLIDAETKQSKKINPKRMQREINKQLHKKGVSTKSQQALKLQREEGKIARKTKSRFQKEEERQRKFEKRQQKRKEKHRGR